MENFNMQLFRDLGETDEHVWKWEEKIQSRQKQEKWKDRFALKESKLQES